MYRVIDPPPEIEAEGERLLGQWEENDEGLSWWDYLAKHASPEALAFMKEIQDAQEDAKQRGVRI